MGVSVTSWGSFITCMNMMNAHSVISAIRFTLVTLSFPFPDL